ncbi:flagellar FLiS export co-chaperone [Helicobacter sp. 11S03491-1]|uniref:flagellar FLiS export co-chaperone n=1 Tax=Helicobacter sp. 11S03491-1 TaxID=1476196 RepID=UPI000BA697F4|nr:flagellar FLiS export co-chaperone [Helicobacter sp. 11S03491-1]PAF43814.1 hypothetical protein BKH45_00685 [Helicobacter sp. 11S03491-1]
MFEKDVLATFKKHLEGMDKPKEVGVHTNIWNKTTKIHQFGEDMKSANEFIGAMQILNIAIKKLIACSQKMLIDNIDENIKDTSYGHLKGMVSKEMNEIIEKCTFMGNALIDVNLSIQSESKAIEFEISNPMPLFEREEYESVIAYLEDKIEDLQYSLELVSAKISSQNIFDASVSNTPSYEHFNSKDFLKRF